MMVITKEILTMEKFDSSYALFRDSTLCGILIIK